MLSAFLIRMWLQVLVALAVLAFLVRRLKTKGFYAYVLTKLAESLNK